MKVPIMKTVSTRQLPNPLDRIQVRTVGWKKIQGETRFMIRAPVRMELGMVVFRVVDDHDRPPTGSRADRLDLLHEFVKCHGVELLPFPLRKWNAPSRSRTAPKYPTLRRPGKCRSTGSFVSGGTHMRQLEPYCWKWTSSSAHKSTVSSVIRARSFFYAPSVSRDRPGRSLAAVSSFGIQDAETTAGIAVRPETLRNASR